MNYSRKRSNIREQFVGKRCKFGLLVYSTCQCTLIDSGAYIRPKQVEIHDLNIAGLSYPFAETER
jgi:hypothetical protein